jgi:hypothetical protein
MPASRLPGTITLNGLLFERSGARDVDPDKRALLIHGLVALLARRGTRAPYNFDAIASWGVAPGGKVSHVYA